MLFNSLIFIVTFLPITFFGWYGLQRFCPPIVGKIFLVGMSLWFYAYYNVWYLAVLLGSILLNYSCSCLLEITKSRIKRKLVFLAGLVSNIGILFYFKYFNFFVDNCNFIFRTSFTVEKIILPLGISFFTFQQISYIADRYSQTAPNYGFWDYTCYVTFFPQLIAGPIVLHSEFIPQLQSKENKKMNGDLIYDGIALFILGLGKKVLLADVLAITVNAEYQSIAYLDMPSAWITIICYMLELYFDFSGYCDMARGIGKMFGFQLPENFNSPLMAVSVKDFWRRWHMTLSRFLTTYIYIPLGGNRRGISMKCRNLMIVFLISGFWHGANWTYVVWGLMHGVAMVWETLFPKLRFRREGINRFFTGIFVTLSFSIFRSDSLQQAGMLFKKLFAGGNNGFLVGVFNTLIVPENYGIRKFLEMAFPQWQNAFLGACFVLLLVVCIVLICGEKAEVWIEKKGCTRKGIILLAVLFVWSFISLSQVSTFLYFDF